MSGEPTFKSRMSSSKGQRPCSCLSEAAVSVRAIEADVETNAAVRARGQASGTVLWDSWHSRFEIDREEGGGSSRTLVSQSRRLRRDQLSHWHVQRFIGQMSQPAKR